MNSLSSRSLLFSSLLLCAASTYAQPVEGYVTTTFGGIAKDGFGGCVRIMAWTAERAGEGCDDFVVRTKAVAAPAVMAVPAAAPALVPAPPPPVSVTPKVARSVDLRSDALFAVNSAELKEEGQPAIDDVLARIRALKGLKSVTIVGHTDSTGWVEHNRKLSERRAQSVKAVLVKNGVDPALITVSGVGARKPIAHNTTPEGRAKNRRVTITLVGTE
jgi:outer membrane protein OmpA-like peptidoglycan-associated protein